MNNIEETKKYIKYLEEKREEVVQEFVTVQNKIDDELKKMQEFRNHSSNNINTTQNPIDSLVHQRKLIDKIFTKIQNKIDHKLKKIEEWKNYLSEFPKKQVSWKDQDEDNIITQNTDSENQSDDNNIDEERASTKLNMSLERNSNELFVKLDTLKQSKAPLNQLKELYIEDLTILNNNYTENTRDRMSEMYTESNVLKNLNMNDECCNISRLEINSNIEHSNKKANHLPKANIDGVVNEKDEITRL